MKVKPHINIGVIGGDQRHFSTLAALGSLIAMAGSPPPGETAFSRLSEAAQDLIVSATMGEFDETGPPEMAPEVRAELEQWAAASEEEGCPRCGKPAPGGLYGHMHSSEFDGGFTTTHCGCLHEENASGVAVASPTPTDPTL